MAAPEVLFDLALTLHPEHDASAQDRAAILAGRLGYREVWLPVGEGSGWPEPGRLADLAAAAGSARVGLVVTGGATEVAQIALARAIARLQSTITIPLPCCCGGSCGERESGAQVLVDE